MHIEGRTIALLESRIPGHPSLYHPECEILIQSTKRCIFCNKQRRSLAAMVSRPHLDDKTDPSSHTTYCNLTNEEKDQRLHRLQQERKANRSKVTRLKQKISKITEEQGIQLDEVLHKDMQLIVDEEKDAIHLKYPENSFQRLFWEQQEKALTLKNARSMRWHPLFIKWCIYLRHLSRASYEMLRNSGCIKLPSQQTLRDYTYYVQTAIGFSVEVDQEIARCADLSKHLNKYVTLVIDEVHIKEELVFDKHQGNLIGFVNLGEINNHLLKFEEMLQGHDYCTLANSMLVFMVRGLFSKFNFPYAQFCCSDLSGDLMFDPFWEAIARLERQGFNVLAVTCDGASTNRRLWKLHANGNKVIHKIPNVYAAEGNRDIYLISDPPHLLKTIRNSWYNRSLWVSYTILHQCYF